MLATTVGPIGTAAGFEDNDGNLAVDNGQPAHRCPEGPCVEHALPALLLEGAKAVLGHTERVDCHRLIL